MSKRLLYHGFNDRDRHREVGIAGFAFRQAADNESAHEHGNCNRGDYADPSHSDECRTLGCEWYGPCPGECLGEVGRYAPNVGAKRKKN